MSIITSSSRNFPWTVAQTLLVLSFISTTLIVEPINALPLPSPLPAPVALSYQGTWISLRAFRDSDVPPYHYQQVPFIAVAASDLLPGALQPSGNTDSALESDPADETAFIPPDGVATMKTIARSSTRSFFTVRGWSATWTGTFTNPMSTKSIAGSDTVDSCGRMRAGTIKVICLMVVAVGGMILGVVSVVF